MLPEALLAALLAAAPPQLPRTEEGVEVKVDALHQVLTDADRNVRVPDWSVSWEDLTPRSKLRWRVEKDVLRGGRQEGVDRIRVDNGVLSFTVVPTRGMNLWEARCGDVRLGWDSPVKEVVHPSHVNLSERGGLGWLEGFGEWVNRCGLASNGSPGEDRVPSNTGAIVPVQLTLHGKVSYLPARRVEVIVRTGGGELVDIEILGVVDETMMFGTQLRLVTSIRTAAGSTSLTIHDEVQNLAATPQEFQILYHANFGTPILGDGARVVAPALRVTPRDPRAAEGDVTGWSRYGRPTPSYVEQVYFLKLAADSKGMTEVLLKSPASDRGVSVGFSTKELPYLTVWKNTGARENGYVTGIEPATNYPNNRSFERRHGRVPRLEGGASYRATVTFTVHGDAKAVADAAARVERLLEGRSTQIDPGPVPELCP
ncbi:MAG: aldose 1-epimerase family protein [Planctomycetes bacterium]|nr:aldose 1-epimerase family protein [Planctomycetota bacterium]